MRGERALALLVGARVCVEAIAFACLAAVAHAVTAGRGPLPLIAATLLLFGGGLLLVSLMREIGTGRRSSTTVVVTLAAAVAASLALPMRAGADGLALLSRAVLFGLLGEALLWRLLGIARGATRWTDVRGVVPFAALALALAALWPSTIDRDVLPALALLAVGAMGMALSLARTSDELALLRGTVGKARASSATGVTLLVGVAAILASAFAPTVAAMLERLGDTLGPVVARVLVWIVLPIAYAAGALVELLRPLVAGRWPRFPQLVPPRTPEEEAALLRQMEQTRPFIFGAVELVVVACAVVVAIMLVDRMLRERRTQLAPGVTLEREPVDGLGLLETLRSLRPGRPRRRRPPSDDGTSAGAIRLLYWRFLALAEARGAGWRSPSETPAEHVWRIATVDAAWRTGEPILRAFEDLRYGETDPSPAALERAREALRRLEARPRAS